MSIAYFSFEENLEKLFWFLNKCSFSLYNIQNVLFCCIEFDSVCLPHQFFQNCVFEQYIFNYLLMIKFCKTKINTIYHAILSIMNFKSELAGIGPIALQPYAVSDGHKTLTLSPMFNQSPTQSQHLITCPTPMLNFKGQFLSQLESNFFPFVSVPSQCIQTVLPFVGAVPSQPLLRTSIEYLVISSSLGIALTAKNPRDNKANIFIISQNKIYVLYSPCCFQNYKNSIDDFVLLIQYYLKYLPFVLSYQKYQLKKVNAVKQKNHFQRVQIYKLYNIKKSNEHKYIAKLQSSTQQKLNTKLLLMRISQNIDFNQKIKTKKIANFVYVKSLIKYQRINSILYKHKQKKQLYLYFTIQSKNKILQSYHLIYLKFLDHKDKHSKS